MENKIESAIDALIEPQIIDGDWDAASFFRQLTEKNRLAKARGYTFCLVSGLGGLEEMIQNFQESLAFVCVSDCSDGTLQLNSTPSQRRVKTVFFALRHAVDDMNARKQAMAELRELFRQYMSILIRQKVKLSQNYIYLDSRISFSEIEEYFASGCACAYCQIAVDIQTPLIFNPDEWLE